MIIILKYDTNFCLRHKLINNPYHDFNEWDASVPLRVEGWVVRFGGCRGGGGREGSWRGSEAVADPGWCSRVFYVSYKRV